MHKLTINIPEDLLRPLKQIALDKDTSITRIITTHLQEVVRNEPVERLAQPAPAKADTPKE